MTDGRARLTPLGVTVLALLREDDMHPYEMLRLMRYRHDDRVLNITGGTVYHTVARLERHGLIAQAGVAREGNRPERTTYTLSDEGREAVSRWIRDELVRIDRPTEFRVALAEAHNLDRAEVIDLLAQRRDVLAARVADQTAGLAKARAAGVPEQYLVEVERQGVLDDADLAWLDGLLARLARPDIPWGPDPDESLTDRYLTQRKAARQ